MTDKTLLAIGKHDETRLAELAETAASIAAPDGEVVVVHVFDREGYEELKSQLNAGRDSELTPNDVARRHGVAAAAADLLDDHGVETSVRGALGDESEAILRVSGEEDADLIVVGGRKRSPSGKALFGSTAQRVMIEADVPVTFVKARAGSEVEAEPVESTA